MSLLKAIFFTCFHILDVYEKEKLLSFAISILNIYGSVDDLRRIEINDNNVDKKVLQLIQIIFQMISFKFLKFIFHFKGSNFKKLHQFLYAS